MHNVLGLIQSITYRFSSLECLYILFFILVMSKLLEYASVVWNSITSTDANKLERIQQNFVYFCFYRLYSYVPYTSTDALEKLNLKSLRKLRQHLDVLTFLFRSIVVLNPALPFWKW
jgi:uncharacterized membrane protein